jgi:antibiotic biosynthesis monooxygenase (ABM) superfamily enzyme
VEVRVSRASSVVVHRVTPDGAERFLEWQRGITAVTTEFPGYQATDIYPPAEGQPEWVVIIHFDHPEALQRWLGSPLRAEWLAKLKGTEARFWLKTLPSGFGAWFTGSLGQSEGALPPSWKMVLSVLLSLYPMVMLLTIFVGPYTKRLGLVTDMLISNALSVSLLQWAVMPVLQIVLDPWLRASGLRRKAITIWGLVLILLTLAGLMLFFHAVMA